MKILIALALIPFAIYGIYIIFGMFFGGLALATSDDEDNNGAAKGCGCLLSIAAIVIVILVLANL